MTSQGFSVPWWLFMGVVWVLVVSMTAYCYLAAFRKGGKKRKGGPPEKE